MLNLQQIIEQYPDQLRRYQTALLREYLQYKILQALFESQQASQLSFIGGTALRIVYGNDRFSEDIDLDNFNLSEQSFADMMNKVKRRLELEDFQVEISMTFSEAFHCYLRFPGLLYKQGLSPLQEHKILIQVDTVAQDYDYLAEIKILNKFDVFTEIRVTPEDLLLSQKIYSTVNRKRAKGRDFYDITFLFSKAKPNFDFIHQKMGICSPEKLRTEFLRRIEDYDFEALAEDVAPFLISQTQVNRVRKFKEFWQQVALVE
jgi:predicted nucleotidyltransferase component of viral defense system